MTHTPPRGTLLNIPLVEERYGKSFAAAVAIHALVLAFFLLAPLLLPSLSPLQLGTGPGGGTGGESYTIGVADDLGGGAGMYKPALTPQPPVLQVQSPKETKKAEVVPKAVPLPGTIESKTKKKAAETPAKSKKAESAPATNVIPVADAKGAGGGGGQGGTGGGAGGGSGISIGSGSGGTMDSWYARAVEARVGSNWIRPVGVQDRIEIIYSFLVDNNGRIYDIKKEKSSGNEALDLTAYRAIQASNPLTQPPPELRGRNLQFVCQFVYPPYR